jgi:hypothetical protein
MTGAEAILNALERMYLGGGQQEKAETEEDGEEQNNG